MVNKLRRPLSLTLVAFATSALGGCYYGDIDSASYASAGYACQSRYGDAYYNEYDPYAYDDGYGYDCYDASDYGAGFVQIGFGGGWYDNYYYPGYGTWIFDNYRNRYPLRGHYLNYWGGRRAWWKHREHRGNHDGHPGRPGGWNRGDGDNNGNGSHGNRPRRGHGNGASPTTGNPGEPIGTPSNRPPRGPDAVRPRPRRPDLSADMPGEEVGRRTAATRPVLRPRPSPQDASSAIPRAPGARRAAITAPDRSAPPDRAAPVVRSAPSVQSAPAARPERAPRPVSERPARANREDRVRAVRGD